MDMHENMQLYQVRFRNVENNKYCVCANSFDVRMVKLFEICFLKYVQYLGMSYRQPLVVVLYKQFLNPLYFLFGTIKCIMLVANAVQY
jgi:hypothetical protein